MADRYDPKLSPRPQGDRRQADARRPQGGDDDPLIELARIVSGKGGFDAPPARSERRAETPRAPLPSDAELAHDLESELLSELQASFSMLQEPLTAAAAAPPPAKAPVPAPAPPQQTAQIIPAPVARIRQVPAEPAAPPPQPPAAQRAEPRVQQQPQQRTARPAPPPERVAPVRPANDADFSNLQFRPTSPAQAPRAKTPEPPPRAPASRWEPRQEPRATEASRYAPPPRPVARQQPAPPAAAPAPRAPDYDDPPFDEPLSFDDEAYYEDDPENFDLVPGYGDEDLLPPFPEEELAALKPRRSGRGIAIIAGILAVVVAGGAAAIMLRSGNTGSDAPPIIAADPSPTKVAPETGKPVDDQGQAKLIYDRVNPGEDAASSQLAEQETDPVTDVAAADDLDNPISRVILPGGPGVDQPADGETAAPAGETAPTVGETAIDDASAEADSSAIQPIGPKKVRTVVVRPDGTILSSEAAPADGSTPATTGETEPLPFGADTAQSSTPVPAPAADAPASPEPTGGGSDIAELERAARDGGAIAAAETGEAVVAEAPAVEPPAPEPAAEASPAPQPPAEPERLVAARTDDSRPIDLTAPSSAASGSGMLVQISSQRSEEAALSTFRDLQKRFPNILGSYEANIQRADLGAKGVYYRVRVGPFVSGDAQKLCDALKSAGGDCLLAQR